MANDFYGYDDDEAPPKGRDNLFIWTVFILLLIGLAFACWLGSFYIFGHPEQPRAYRILKKLHKIEKPERFKVTAAPPGEFISAQKLFDKYGKSTRLELERENAELLRNYITNYREPSKLVPYIRGKFNILDSYELKKTDIFPSGVVALAQAADFPQMLIEHVYPAALKDVPLQKKMLQTGLDMSVERTIDLSAIIHVERVYNGRLLFTVVPLLYGTYALKGGQGTFGLEPPEDINIEAGVPITKLPQLQEGFKRFAEYRKGHPITVADAGNPAPPSAKGPELVRIDSVPDGVEIPQTGALPEMPVATPVPIIVKAATPKPVPPAPTPTRLVLNTTPPPATPRPVPVATPLPKVSPQGVPLTPFLAANPSPGLPSVGGGNWRVYGAGKQPPGRHITPPEAASIADRGDLGERVYLRGQFLVTAAGEGKAVLRPQAGADAKRGTPTRIIVEYPAGSVPPSEGTSFARDEARAFEVRDIRRGADGELNIYVREVTSP
ncbi:MAG: hypothetical protein JWL90_4301 [Chthoniobacteraceae bacterium]|nr:hypothetical protein [Chthoniobacteraceae bacterium]